MAINLTFSGAGFLGIYHVGAVSCLKFYGKKFLENVDNFGGSSAGALSACMLLFDVDLEESVQFVMHLASKVHGKFLGPLNPSFDPGRSIRNIFMRNLPKDAYKRACGKMHISLTRVSDWKNIVVSEYDSNEDLVDALVCTSFIPIFSGVTPPKFKGEAYVDGGFTDNLPQQFNGVTVTISPFSGESDICPDDGHKSFDTSFDLRNTNIHVTSHNIYRMSRALFPPSGDVLSDICRHGFKDTLKYLHIHYPEMLNFDVNIVSIPLCCDTNGAYDSSDDASSTCSCSRSSVTSPHHFSDMENCLAKNKAINTLIFPDQLNKILHQTVELFNEIDVGWYLACGLFRLSKWLMRPYYYFTQQMYSFVDSIFKLLLPQIKELSEMNIYTKKIVEIGLEIYYAYNGNADFEWHPSLKRERYEDIVQSRQRILTAQMSLVVLPKTSKPCDPKCTDSNDKLTVPPPSRVSSSNNIIEKDLTSSLNNIFHESDELNSDNVFRSHPDFEYSDSIHLPHCLSRNKYCTDNDDDGLYLKIDFEENIELTSTFNL